MTKNVLLEKSAGVFLDITSCGSSVRWGVEVHEIVDRKGKSSLSAETQVNLTDCNRAITWSDNYYTDYGALDTQLKKIDVAIDALIEYRRALREANRIIARYQKEHPQNDA